MKGEEPSVLDYFKSFFHSTEDKERMCISESKNPVSIRKKGGRNLGKFSLWALVAFIVALAAQSLLEPPSRFIHIAVLLYIIALALIWFGVPIESMQENRKRIIVKSQRILRIKTLYFIVSLICLLGAFWCFSGNEFNWTNLILWILSLSFFILSVWKKQTERKKKLYKIDNFLILIICVSIVVLFFRLYELEQVPGEMFSDHAEKLLDIVDVLDGKTPIFFVRNTGREALQFYLTAVIIKLFKTGLTFLSLKIGMALAGIITLPYIYLLAKEYGNRWVALLSVFFAGIAYWPNVISRVALRFALYPLFTAPMLYYLIKGLKTGNSNYFIMSGIALGLGLHGYSPARFLPFVVVAAFILYIPRSMTAKERLQTISHFILLALTAFIVFLPLFRFAIGNYDYFGYRAFSRLMPIERSYPGSPVIIFLDNLWKAITMFFYNNGEIWVHSIPNRPALDMITAASFFIGIVIVIKRYFLKRNWIDLFLLLAIILLIMPSVLSLTFPSENPSLNRTAGAYVCVFIVASIGFMTIVKRLFIFSKSMASRIVVILCVIALLSYSAYINFNLVFDEYNNQFLAKAWNSTEITRVITDFINKGGEPDNAYVVPYPYWVDTRLVGINAGFPRKDYALWPGEFENTMLLPGEKIFILKPEDSENLNDLIDLYPQASFRMFNSSELGKDFIILTTSLN